MACCLFGAKQLPASMLTYVQLDPKNKLPWNSNQNMKLFIRKNAFENMVCEMVAILSWGDKFSASPTSKQYPNLVFIVPGNML